MKKKSGPKFVQYFDPVLQALKVLGGSGRPAEIIEHIASRMQIPESEKEILAGGTSRFDKNINWARFYLMKAGFIDGSTRGVWALTEKGMRTELSPNDALIVFDEVQNLVRQSDNGQYTAKIQDNELIDEEQIVENIDHRRALSNILYNLPPAGFERLCQRILRESGFEKVVVTGRTGDGGIDGQGILRVNPFVSFQVSFQCKRYSGSVGAGTIRDFRGSIMGRADKGIIMTTGAFTSDAKKEATRDGATPIELVDGEQIMDMLEGLELGVIKKRTITIYEVDENFFNEFYTP